MSLTSKPRNLTGPPARCAGGPQHQNDMDKNKAWDALIEQGVSEETLKVITAINGWSIDTMEAVLFAVTGYRSFDQLKQEVSE